MTACRYFVAATLLISSGLFCQGLHAQGLPDADVPRQAIQDSSRQLNRWLEEQRYRQLEQGSSAPLSAPAAMLPESEQCLPLSAVYLRGVTLLDKQSLRALPQVSPQCITTAALNALIRQLTEAYLQRGYIAARVILLPVDAEGALTLQVIEGHLEAIEGDSTLVNSATLLPGKTGQPLNIHDLDQALDQANRLAANHVQADILPGRTPGGSVIRLLNSPDKRWHLTASTDNEGQKSTGRWQTRLSAALDSPLGLSDSLNMSAGTTLTDDTERYNRSYTLLYSVPYGYATFSAFASHSDYLNTQPLQIYSVQLSGHTDQAGLRADYVVARDQRSINTLSVQLTRKQSRNYFADALLGISSPTLSVLSLSAARMQILDRGLVSLSASVDQGTPWLGADAPPPRGLSGLPDSHFTKFTVNADLYRYFQPAGLNLQWHSQLAAQYSADPLPGIEWFTVSDTYAVRGFSSSNVAADSGAFWRNDLTYRRPLLGGELRLLTGADIGQTLRGATHNPTYYAGGLTVGSDYQYQAVQAGIRVSRGRMWSAGRHTTEPLRVLARFSVSF